MTRRNSRRQPASIGSATRLAILAVLLAGAAGSAASGQSGTTTLRPGATIRMVAPQLGFRRATGTLLDVRQDTLVFAVRGFIPKPGTAFELSLISRLEVSRGWKPQSEWGAVIGAVLGATVGTVLFSAYCEDLQGDAGRCGTGPALLGAFLGAGPGAVGGWLAGKLYKTHIWEPVPLDRYGLGVNGTPATPRP